MVREIMQAKNYRDKRHTEVQKNIGSEKKNGKQRCMGR